MLKQRSAETPAMRPRVYVVDDDEAMRDALGRLLRSAGFAFELFASAREFLDERRPGGACLVLDLRMAGMTGMELLEKLSSVQPDLPVVMITAHGTEEVRRRALLGGATAFLCKPFPQAELLGALDRAMGNTPQEVMTGAEPA